MKLVWSRQAKADLDRIWHFHAERDVAFADRIEISIRARVTRLLEFPMLGRHRDSLAARELSLVDLQYRVAYIVEDEQIRIAAVRSTREEP